MNGPNKAPERKARVFRGARDRIVDTDKRLARSAEMRAQTERKLNQSRRDFEDMARTIHDPARSAMTESLYRQVGAQMADLAFERIAAEIGHDLSDMATDALRSLAQKAGFEVAETLTRKINDVAEISTDIERYAEERMHTRVHIPATDVHFVKSINEPI